MTRPNGSRRTIGMRPPLPLTRRAARGGARAALLASLLIWLGFIAAETWLATLFLGMAHGYDDRVPAFGWPVVWLLTLTISMMVKGSSGGGK